MAILIDLKDSPDKCVATITFTSTYPWWQRLPRKFFKINGLKYKISKTEEFMKIKILTNYRYNIYNVCDELREINAYPKHLLFYKNEPQLLVIRIRVSRDSRKLKIIKVGNQVDEVLRNREILSNLHFGDADHRTCGNIKLMELG